MFNFQIHRLLLSSTVISNIFSLFIIAMTIVHHLSVQQRFNQLTELVTKQKESN